jgi:hypothetical protein
MEYPVIDGTVFDDTVFRHTVQDTARRDRHQWQAYGWLN